MNRRRVWIALAVMALCMGVWGAGAYAEANAKPAETTVIESTAESPEALLPQDPGNTWPVTIDPKTGETTCENGADITMAEALDITKKKAENLTGGTEKENRQEILDYLEDQDIYEVSEEKGQIHVEFPYAYRQLIVLGDEGSLGDTHGAVNSVYCRLTGFYILQYGDEQAAWGAYDALKKELGEGRVAVDIPIHSQAYVQNQCSLTTAKSTSWGSDKMRLDTVRDKANASKITRKVKVAILDSGINKTHEMFSGRTILPGSTTFVPPSGAGDYAYYDDTANSKVPGHGTHVAGIIDDGTSKQIQFLILKVFDSTGAGSVSNFLQALSFAASQKVDIINYSGGSNVAGEITAADEALYKKYLKSAWDKGSLLVCAAGNDGKRLEEVLTYPAYMPYNISVTAMAHDDGDDQNGGLTLQSFTNYGSAVDFTAPGVDVASAGIASDTYYVYMSGTSMAAPHITAAAAMVKLYNPTARPGDIYKLLRGISYHPGAVPDIYYGYGIPIFNKGVPKLPQPAKPKGTSLKSLTAGKKKLTVRWKKQKKLTTGYQIQVATNRKFTKNKKTVTVVGAAKTKAVIKKLKKGKTYYVRIRTFRKVSGKKLYSAWSKVKRKKIK